MGNLIVTRRMGEAVDCSQGGRPLVTVKVLGFLPSGQVRLLFIADRSVTIMRDDAITRRYEDGNDDDKDPQGAEQQGNNSAEEEVDGNR